ncbi:MAG: EAL domain-containing protein [Desulfobulbus sp.]|jgi:lactose/cellobiose-specific phosphotransferase system IIC component
MKRYTDNLLQLSLREAFLEIVPYYVLASLGSLMTDLFGIDAQNGNMFIQAIVNLFAIFDILFPFLLIISISIHLASNYHVDRFPVIALSFFVFFGILLKSNVEFMVGIQKVGIYALIVPISCFYSYFYINKIECIKIIKSDIVNKQLAVVVNSILPVLVIYLVFVQVFPYIGEYVFANLTHFFASFINTLSIALQTLIQVITVHCIWWATGIHGTHIYTIFADTSYLNLDIFPGITAQVFLFNFVVPGGVGATLSLIMAILVYSKNDFSRKIAWLALPFGIFNINEILLFALPVIINIRFIIPFLLVPICNFIISYLVLAHVPVPEPAAASSFAWTMPTLLSGYLLGQGQSWAFMLVQLCNLVCGMLIYLPFMARYDRMQNVHADLQCLADKCNIPDRIESMLDRTFLRTQAEIIQQRVRTGKIIEEVIAGDFLMHYQPKIDLHHGRCCGFEALLRLRNREGEIVSPFFMPQIEQAGYAYIIDLWVIRSVAEDIRRWNEAGFFPKLSINLSPESLNHPQIIERIIRQLKNKEVEIEILERTFEFGQGRLFDNIHMLKDAGFTIGIDDFGTGFSSLQYLHALPVDVIKLDREFLVNATEKSILIYKNMARMCQDLHYTLISEGVETRIELEFVQSLQIHIVQGHYFAPALSFAEAAKFSREFRCPATGQVWPESPA